jgi:copper homeostasis protein
MAVMLEVCVDSAAGLAEAVAGGADRIELCAALAVGGLTPSPGLMMAARDCPVPVMVMIRPRAGNFVWSGTEVAMLEAEIAATRAAGLAGVVLGASLPDGRLDAATLSRLVAAAGDMDLTLHRAIDLTPDMGVALEAAIALGFRRILTSGGEKTAEAGIARIAALIAKASGRISVMPGSGITPANAGLFKGLGITEIHGSCSVSHPAGGRVVELGFSQASIRQTSADQVRDLRRALA